MVIITAENFTREVLQSPIPVVVDFYADWCGPCQTVGLILEELAGESEGKIKFGKLNVDENPPIAAKYKVMSIPTVIVFRDGKEVGRKIGLTGKIDLIDLMSNYSK